jgi:hypothetical protein
MGGRLNGVALKLEEDEGQEDCSVCLLLILSVTILISAGDAKHSTLSETMAKTSIFLTLTLECGISKQLSSLSASVL